ncbi:hypothetical protein PT974_02008 [Cladobotryum mycophilum]|uniref:C2H2-type domain-containing protein n=1 Tax=Cladobotryum mycophilum TaxID=491253 RepID=A0ABR0SX51_9HYPO
MFSYNSAPDDTGVRPLTDEDQQLLLGLVHKYGVSSLLCALTPYGEPSRASVLSANTILSSTSASSMGWTNSEVASQCRSDEASIHTQYTWPDVANDIPPMPEVEPLKSVNDPPSPRLVTPTTKKYQCPMCFLDNSPVGFGRKSDFKKHLHNFHGADTVWICRTKSCHLSFSTERAYSTHAKDAHRMKALPNSAARTDMCPQLVFSCGFGGCRDRVFEAHNADDASTTREKHFEHIAKHFEDGFDVNDWEYRVQIQNLMRQKQVKSIWKTCIWPKEKRQALHWRARSSGDLKRMLECRHLGSNIPSLVRLAFILGTPPFTTSSTPPPAEVDVYFQLPYKSQCLLGPAGHAVSGATAKTESEAGSPGPSSFSVAKHRSQAMLKLAARQMKRTTRPSTPASVVSSSGDTIMGDDLAAGPHPGTPFPIPNEAVWPLDAPKFAPEAPTSLPKQINSPMDLSINHQQHQHQQQLLYTMPEPDPSHQPWMTMDTPMPHYGGHPQPQEQQHMMPTMFDYPMNVSPTPNTRPGTPVPIKRPASWNRVMSMEALRPSKKPMPNSGPYPGDVPPGMLMSM